MPTCIYKNRLFSERVLLPTIMRLEADLLFAVEQPPW